MPHLELPANDLRPTLDYPLYETDLHRLVVWLAQRLTPLVMDLRVSGADHLPTSGPVVVTCNHLVNFDVFPLQLALPRMVFYMGKAELFQNRLVHAVFRRMGAFPVYRGERDTWALEHARQVLASGQLVAMFPEGTRSRGKGLALAKPGAAKLAIEMSCPVLVVSIDGIQRIFKTFPRRTVVNVVIAPLIVPRPDESPVSLTDHIMFTMAANLPESLRGVYAEIPKGFKQQVARDDAGVPYQANPGIRLELHKLARPWQVWARRRSRQARNWLERVAKRLGR
jgi:1-acyl-sn-glycerol-3-phosphate acyltransferase